MTLHFIHYGERAHIEAFFRDGSIQIGTLRAYDVASHGPMIGDDSEGLSFCTLTDEIVEKLESQKRHIPDHLMASFGPGCRGNVVFVHNVSFNYAMFCMTRVLHQKLCKNFKDSYEAAIYIERPFPFFAELDKAFTASGLADKPIFQQVADIVYRSREVEGPDELECFIKEPRYSHQFETRAIWNAGLEPPPFFRFKAPDAVRCCRPILFDDMPNYEPGISEQELDSAMLRAINACSRDNYLNP